MKKLIATLIMVCLIITFAGCSTIQNYSIAGTYYGQKNSTTYLKLNSDGTFTTLLGMGGTYEVHGNQLVILTGFGAYTYIISGNTLTPQNTTNILSGSESFVKK